MWLNRFSRERQSGLIAIAAFIAALFVTILLTVTGLTGALENGLRDGRDTLRLAPATGDIVVVEIDGRSLQSLDSFPWPRSYHAAAVTELERLGASQIAFDIDFSARSSPEEDAQFASALAQLDQPAVLATFRQYNLAGEERTISEALPIPVLREESFMTSVNVHPSADGRIIQYPHGVTTNGTARPSLANMLAKSGGEIDASFTVDQAIDMRSIPRVSFVDLIEGRVPRAMVAGKQAVIGATAIELGDRYPTSLFGVQPGVFVHVQAAETLIQNRARDFTTQWPPLIFAGLVLALFLFVQSRAGKSGSASGIFAVIVSLILIGAALALDQMSATYVALSSACVFLLGYLLIRQALLTFASLDTARTTNALSGLPNRYAFQAAARRKSNPTFAVARIADIGEIGAIIDEEQWRDFNQAVARRLRLVNEVGEVYHLNSGVFGWFLDEAQTSDPAGAFASARALFNSPIEIADQRLRLGVHFGSSTQSVADAEDASELARKRGIAWSANADALHEETQFRQRLLGELDEALENGAISVVFQPKLRLSDGAFSAGECLVRWHSKKLGHIPPSDFIPILEEKGRIADLTMFVLREAIARRDEVYAQGLPLNLAVNVSAQLLSDAEFVDAAVELLKKNGAKALGGISLEITESAPLADSQAARTALERLDKVGARISIDDYGTGQASLNYLQDFPAQEIKLDQSFVRNLMDAKKDRIMVQSTIDLAHALGFDIVAEGVETAEILDVLVALGCDYGQGWEIGHPVPWGEFVQYLGQKRELAKAA